MKHENHWCFRKDFKKKKVGKAYNYLIKSSSNSDKSPILIKKCAILSITLEELLDEEMRQLIRKSTVTSRNTWLLGLSFQTSGTSGQQLPFAIPVDQQDITRKATAILI